MKRAFAITGALTLILALAALVVIKTLWWRPTTMSDVANKMRGYQEQGRYDAAIALANEWVSQHPNDGSNDQIFGRIALLYVDKAKKDPRNREQFLREAVRYRDKMLPVAGDSTLGWYSMGGLLDAALISEAVGDVSSEQQCVQYRNALKLLEQLRYSLKDKQEEISDKAAKQDAFGYTPADVERLLNEANTATDRIKAKQQPLKCA
jgi:tetratricopeptide (TPR) repeat protein